MVQYYISQKSDLIESESKFQNKFSKLTDDLKQKNTSKYDTEDNFLKEQTKKLKENHLINKLYLTYQNSKPEQDYDIYFLSMDKEQAQKFQFYIKNEYLYIEEQDIGLFLVISYLYCHQNTFNQIIKYIQEEQKVPFLNSQQALESFNIFGYDDQQYEKLFKNNPNFKNIDDDITITILELVFKYAVQSNKNIFNYQELQNPEIIQLLRPSVFKDQLIIKQIFICLENKILKTSEDYKNLISYKYKGDTEDITECSEKIDKKIKDKIKKMEDNNKAEAGEIQTLINNQKDIFEQTVVQYLVYLGNIKSNESFVTEDQQLQQFIKETLENIDDNKMQQLVQEYQKKLNNDIQEITN